jgi:hypothetical protein
MSPGDTPRPRPEPGDDAAIRCDACASALRSPGREAISFLLLDHLTIPLVGCADHLEQFRSVCGFTTEGTADLLAHRPAGGVSCPGCRLAPHDHRHPTVPVEDGVVVALACPTHRSEVVERFRTGLRTRRQLTSSIDTT